METKKKKEQFKLADVLFEMGMDFDVIEAVSGITPQEMLLNKINLVHFTNETRDEENVIEKDKEDSK